MMKRVENGVEKPLILAHRGASYEAPENTMEAFELAVEEGASGFELDVHLSKDGELVVIHDETVDRTTNGSGWVGSKTLAELKALDAGSKKDKKYAGARIPTLDELLDEFKDKDLYYNIEIKSGVVDYPGIEEALIQTIRRYELDERVIVSSFDHYSLRRMKRLAPEIRTGILYAAGLYEPWEYARQLEADALHPYFPGVRSELVEAAHSKSLWVNPWTVDDPVYALRLAKIGCDALITNKPGLIRDALEGGNGE